MGQNNSIKEKQLKDGSGWSCIFHANKPRRKQYSVSWPWVKGSWTVGPSQWGTANMCFLPKTSFKCIGISSDQSNMMVQLITHLIEIPTFANIDTIHMKKTWSYNQIYQIHICRDRRALSVACSVYAFIYWKKKTSAFLKKLSPYFNLSTFLPSYLFSLNWTPAS